MVLYADSDSIGSIDSIMLYADSDSIDGKTFFWFSFRIDAWSDVPREQQQCCRQQQLLLPLLLLSNVSVTEPVSYYLLWFY